MDVAAMLEQMKQMMPQVPHATTKAMHIGFDDLPFIEVVPGVEVQMLHVDLKQGLWINRNRFKPGTTIEKHYHTGPVFAVTQQGRWFYKEYPEEVNTAGSYLFEPAGSVHTLTVPADNKEPTIVWFAIFGCNVNMGPDDKVTNVLDGATMLNGYKLICEATGRSSEKLIVVK